MGEKLRALNRALFSCHKVGEYICRVDHYGHVSILDALHLSGKDIVINIRHSMSSLCMTMINAGVQLQSVAMTIDGGSIESSILRLILYALNA
jgi:hypothetical protein